MFWLIFLALMLLIPTLAGVYTWRELRQDLVLAVNTAPSSQYERSSNVLSLPGSPRL
ncbi:MAG: hypothetical protein WCK70_13765 [Chloroflexales bacterium]